MIVSARITLDDFQKAMESADKLGTSAQSGDGRLYSPLAGPEQNRAERIWDRIKQGLKEAYSKGKALGTDFIERITEEVESLIKDFSTKASALIDFINAKVQAFLDELFETALSTVRSELKIGGRTLPLKSVALVRKVSLSGSLSLSVTNAARAIANGEISINASYEA
jgi:hypothetical protein